jgi:hypothetical protein
MDGALRSYRRRLPNRRKAITEMIVIGNITLMVTIGFDETGRPAEVFLATAMRPNARRWKTKRSATPPTNAGSNVERSADNSYNSPRRRTHS